MNMMYLLIWLNNAMVVMPEQYPEAQCEAIVKDLKGFSKIGLCISAPKLTIMKDESRLEQFKDKYGECYMNGMALICPLDKVK